MHSSRVKVNPAKVIQLSLAFITTLVVLSFNSQTTPVGAVYTSTSSSVTSAPFDGSLSQNGAQSQQSPLVQTVSQKSPAQSRQFGDVINDIQIECNSENIVVTLNTNHGFNGMIYPKGLSKNSTCMMEYHQLSANITYYLPLRSCNTMSSEVEDGVEYFNTVMVQPHRRLVTNQGRGYNIRCRYQTKERTISNQDQHLSINLTQSTPSVVGSATMPSCSMRIYSAQDLSREVAAENVRIGDELHLIISLDDQDVYGMLVTNCLVRDGMNWGEQPLLDDYGCPIDEEIMPQFSYAQNLTQASVTFQAHKFPYTSSVYYQCNVRLCFRDGGCNHVPPNCDKRFDPSFKSRNEGNNELHGRHRRWVDGGELDAVASDEVKPRSSEPKAMSIEVFSGLRVDEGELESAAADADKDDPMMMASTNDDPQETQADNNGGNKSSSNKQQSERDFCMSLRKFAIAISLASLLLMTAIIIMIACLIQRRKRRKLEESQLRAASIYDHQHNQGPYTNRGYCRD